MSSARLLRPLLRTHALARPFRTAAFSTKISKAATPFAPSVATQIPIRTRKELGKTAPPTKAPKPELQKILLAGMPQLVPFYFINEVVTAWIILPTLIYLMTKYWLPQTVRTKLARLFITKL